jgi:hypothetical protein
MKSDESGIYGAASNPRIFARSKTSNSFPLNKTISKNRAFLRGFSGVEPREITNPLLALRAH